MFGYSSYTEFVETLALYTWGVSLFNLIVVGWHCKQDHEFKSSFISMLLAVTVSGIMTSYTPDLKQQIRHAEAVGDLVAHSWGLFRWYVGFIAFDLMTMLLIWKIHAWYRVRYSFISKTYLLAYLCLCLLQIMRYGERLIFGSSSTVTQPFYKAGVLSINNGLVITVAVFLLCIAVSQHRTKKGKSGVSWLL